MDIETYRNNKALTKKDKINIAILVSYMALIFFTMFEFRLQEYSPWDQMSNSIVLPTIFIIFLVLWFFKKKIFSKLNNLSIKDYIGLIFLLIVMSASISIPVYGFLSLANRTIGHKTEYLLRGEIINLDSNTTYNKGLSSVYYMVRVKEKSSNKEFEFQIYHDEYRRLQANSFFEKKLTKGSLGFLYLYE